MTDAAWPPAVILGGRYVTLEPLARSHHDDLAEACEDGDLASLWFTNVPTAAEMEAEIARRLHLRAIGSMLPFAVVEQTTAKAVGMTTYMNVDAANRRLEIGSTWYRKSRWRSAVNTESKLLLLEYAFERLVCIAVEFRTAFVNHRSRRAIERLGAKLDGVLRNHAIYPNGALRDTCVYSIIGAEWPAVRAGLTYELTRPRD